MITFLNILLVAALLVLVLMAAFSASMTDPPPADMDTPDALPATDNDWSDNNNKAGGALPGQYQSSRSSSATLTMQAASTPILSLHERTHHD